MNTYNYAKKLTDKTNRLISEDQVRKLIEAIKKGKKHEDMNQDWKEVITPELFMAMEEDIKSGVIS